MKRLVIFLLRIYQKTHILGHGTCRYYPTCSQYTVEAIKKEGAFRGLYLGFLRLLRCHPWAKGGLDKIA